MVEKNGGGPPAYSHAGVTETRFTLSLETLKN